MTAVTRIMFFIAYFRRATARVPNTRKTEAKLQPKKGTGPEGPVRIFPGYATVKDIPGKSGGREDRQGNEHGIDQKLI